MFYWLLLAVPVIAFCICFFAFYIKKTYPKRSSGKRSEESFNDETLSIEPEDNWLEMELLGLGEPVGYLSRDSYMEDTGKPDDSNETDTETEAVNNTPVFFHRPFPIKKADILAMLLITVCYGIIAFMGLGSRQTPESFAVFNNDHSSTILEIPGGKKPDKLMLYTGIGTGKYIVETSVDGEEWEEGAEFEQKYSELLKWQTVMLSDGRDAAFIKITATNQNMYLGEVRAFDETGEVIAVNALDELSEKLSDEKEIPSVDTSYLYNSYFDEIYHARTAYEHIENLYPYEVSHPPLGKVAIGIGIRLFGMNPFGWRFTGTLFGILMLPLIYIFLKNMFGKTLVAVCGTLLFAFDFMHFVQTRIATIDTYGVFYIILMFYFMYRYFVQDYDVPFKRTLLPLFLSGLFFGLGAASKWTVVYGGLGLLTIYVIRQVLRGRYYKKLGRRGFAGYLSGTLLVSIVFFIIIPAAVYILSYIPYGTAMGMNVSEGMLWDPEFLKTVWDNQKFMLSYHGKLVAEHPYSSPWWMWIINLRPILYYLKDLEGGMKSSFAAFGNPVIWWTGIGAVISLAIAAIKRRDKLALFILIGYFAQLLPWMIISRIAFVYHYFPNVIFIILGISYMFNDLCERKRNNLSGAVPLLTAVALLLFVVFYPVLTGIPCDAKYPDTFLRWFNGMWPF